MSSPGKRIRFNNSEYDLSPDWSTAFSLTSLQAICPAFAVLQLGEECNAHASALFTEANCNFKKITSGSGPSLFVIDFEDIFSKGIDLLLDLKNKARSLNADEQRAVDILDNFFKEKEKHEQSLSKVLGKWKSEDENSSIKKKDACETYVTVALAEHLLKKLAPGQSYAIDNRARGKKEEKCMCGFDHCSSKPVFESTGIGDERAWHGFIDIVFSSHPVAAVSSKELLGDTEKEEQEEEAEDANDEEECSPGGKMLYEAKRVNTNLAAENQAIAQTIVFSYIQRKRHPSFKNFLIPNILITPLNFRILMYDSENDILICSVKLPIFQDKDKPGKLSIESVVFLWIVLHYRMFCVGINVKELLDSGSIKDLKEIQANFRKRAGEKFQLYEDSSTKIGIARFQSVHEERFPSYDNFLYGKRLFKPRRHYNHNL